MKRFRYKSIAVVVATCLTLAFSTSVSAYFTFNKHVLINGIDGSKFYYLANTNGSYWDQPFNNAFSSWRNKVPIFKFVKTSNQSASLIDCYIYSGDVNTNGYTEWYTNQTQLDPDKTNWFWSKIYINTNALANTLSSYDNGVAGHEIGHAIGLAHNQTQDVIMCQAAYGRTVTTPQADDINGVNALY